MAQGRRSFNPGVIISIVSIDGNETRSTDFYNGKNPVINRIVPTLQLGLGVVFSNNLNRRGLEISYLLNLGTAKMVQSKFDFMYDNPFNSNGKSIGVNNYKGEFFSRGTFSSISVAYPITILNKKGERYRDRHPK